MAYRKIFLTINAETGKQVDAANMEEVRKAEYAQMFLDEYVVLCMTYLNTDGTAHTGFGASDTWSMGTDNDFTHYSLILGTLTADKTGAVTEMAMSYAADPTATLKSTGHIWPINAAGNTERVEYSAVVVSGTGPYVATFTVAKTLDNSYLTGDICKVEESLLAWAANAAFNTGEWSAEDVTGGKISCRFALTATALSTAIGSAALLEDSLCEITRYEVTTANPSKPGQFKVTFRNIVVDSEAQPVLQPTDFSQLDARYHQIGDAKYNPATELTIATGSITRAQMMHDVDTQADAASDDLDTIAGGAEGDIMRLYLANSGRIVTITNAGNINTTSGLSIVMAAEVAYDFYFDGTNWLINDYIISGSPVAIQDSTFTIYDEGDVTKIFKFQASGITTGNTRTITVPDADIVMAGSAAALTPTILPFATTGGLLADSDVTHDGTNYGFGTTGPDAKVDILATTEQLRLTYADGSVFASFTLSSAGVLTIAPSGNKAIIDTVELFNGSGDRNVNIGHTTVGNAGAGNFNVAIGLAAGQSLAAGSTQNVLMGYTAGWKITTGEKNVAIGFEALNALTDASNCIAIGSGAMENLTTGNADNIAIGRLAMAGAVGSGDDNIAIGQSAMAALRNGATNVAIGKTALDALTDGNGNVALGNSAAGAVTTGSQNICFGTSAGGALIDGDQNMIFGNLAGANITTTDFNVCIGPSAGRFHADGTTPLATPVSSIYIGFNSKGKDDSDDNTIVIGALAIGQGANTAKWGNTSITDHYFSGKVRGEQGHFGDVATNYAQFAADGELNLFGTARVMKEVRIFGEALGLGASAPALSIVGNYEVAAYGIGDDSVFSVEIPYDWAAGTDISVEIHWACNETYAANSGEVQFSIPWSAAAVGEDYETPTHTGTIDSGDINIPAAARELAKTTLGTIAGASLAANDVLGFTFTRVALDAGSNPTAEPEILFIDIEYMADKLGEAT